MSFHHEKLTVYQRALEFAGWSQELIESLAKKTSTRDQLERAGDSIALNINSGRDRKDAFRDARPIRLQDRRGFGGIW
jgi:four helix bundle protein